MKGNEGGDKITKWDGRRPWAKIDITATSFSLSLELHGSVNVYATGELACLCVVCRMPAR